MSEGVAAHYNDGLVAATKPVRVTEYGAELAIHAEDGSTIATWLLSELRIVGQPDRAGSIVVCRLAEGARLRIDDPGLAALLLARAPNLHRDPYARGVATRTVALASIGALVSIAVLFRFLLPLFATQAALMIPAEVEARSGRWMADAVVGIFAKAPNPTCESPAGKAAFDQIAARLEAVAQLRLPLSLRVIRVPLVNAVTLPGSQVIFFSQLIAQATSPNEVAGVLAHEIAHAELRHPTETTIRVTATSFLVGLLFGDVIGGSTAAGAAQAIIGASYSREAEAAADARAVELMAAAGYDVRPMADFFEKMARVEAQTPVRTQSWFASHPAPLDRAQKIRAAARPGAVALPAPQWQALKAICDTPK